MTVLVVDIGGTHIKCKTPRRREPLKFDSGHDMTPSDMMDQITDGTKGWIFDRVSLGYPGVVVHDRPLTEPFNLGRGWVGFDYPAAFGKPVRILNDAAMQALGSYKGKRMLFLGLGTGLGAAMVANGVVQSLELAHLPWKGKKTYEDFLGEAGLKHSGKKKWKAQALEIVEYLQKASQAEEVVLGGGNARLLGDLPKSVRLGSNDNAFRGGVDMWREPSE